MDNLYSSVSKGGCYNANHYKPQATPLLKSNYLSEFSSEAEKELVKQNLGIYSDSLLREFIVNNKMLKDQIPQHGEIDTLYNALKDLYLKVDNNAENLESKDKRILSLETATDTISDLQDSEIKTLLGELPLYIPGDLGGYWWPENISKISGGYLKALYDYIKTVETYAETSIGEYAKETTDANGNPISYNKYGRNPEFTVKAAIDDLDYRLTSASDLLSKADDLSQTLDTYKDRITEDSKALAEFESTLGSTESNLLNIVDSAQKSLENKIEEAEQNIKTVLGENGETPTGLYKDLADFNKTTEDKIQEVINELGNYSTTNEDGTTIPASGVRKELEDIKTNFDDYVKTSLEILETNTKTTIDDYVAEVSEIINKTALDAEDSVEEAKKLIYGDENSEDPEKQKSLQTKIEEAQALVTSAEEVIKQAEESIERTGLDAYYDKTSTDSKIAEAIETAVTITNLDNVTHKLNIVICSSLPTDSDASTFYFIKEV